MLHVAAGKNDGKFRGIKQSECLLPVTLRQICEVEKIPDDPDGGFQNRMLHGCHKGKIIFPVIADNVKIPLDDVPFLQLLPMEAERNFFIAADKLRRQAFHPQIGGKNRAAGKLSLGPADMEGALINLALVYGNLYFCAGEIKRTILIIEVSLQNLIDYLLHLYSPTSALYSRKKAL